MSILTSLISSANFNKSGDFEQVIGIYQFHPEPDPHFRFLCEHGARGFTVLTVFSGPPARGWHEGTARWSLYADGHVPSSLGLLANLWQVQNAGAHFILVDQLKNRPVQKTYYLLQCHVMFALNNTLSTFSLDLTHNIIWLNNLSSLLGDSFESIMFAKLNWMLLCPSQ